MKKKYFCTRKWGFGSNILNYYKYAFFCHHHNIRLILQDGYNVIGNNFELFSVVKLPQLIERSNAKMVIPIEDYKSLFKFILFGNYKINEKILYSFSFIFGMKSELFLNHFNTDVKVNDFFLKNYRKNRSESLNICWNYNSLIKDIFDTYNTTYSMHDFIPDLAIQIRGGDKIEEVNRCGLFNASLDTYVSICINRIKDLNLENAKVYVMTDTFTYYAEIKSQIQSLYPLADIRSFVKKTSTGYCQEDFDNLDYSSKLESYYFFLYELEFLRKAATCIGSYNSNIFYLASTISYESSNIFIPVDTLMHESFL